VLLHLVSLTFKLYLSHQYSQPKGGHTYDFLKTGLEAALNLFICLFHTFVSFIHLFFIHLFNLFVLLIHLNYFWLIYLILFIKSTNCFIHSFIHLFHSMCASTMTVSTFREIHRVGDSEIRSPFALLHFCSNSITLSTSQINHPFG